MELKTKY